MKITAIYDTIFLGSGEVETNPNYKLSQLGNPTSSCTLDNCPIGCSYFHWCCNMFFSGSGYPIHDFEEVVAKMS
jgi:hypothetical protein